MQAQVVRFNTQSKTCVHNLESINSIGAAVSIRADTATAPDRNSAVVASGGRGLFLAFHRAPYLSRDRLSVAPDADAPVSLERAATGPAVSPKAAGPFLSGQQVRQLLREAIPRKKGAVKVFIYRNSLSYSSVRHALCGTQKPSQAIASALGVRMADGRTERQT